MNIRNFTQISFDHIKNSKNKTFVINKLKKDIKIPNLKQKINVLFNSPENYLKLANETSFQFIIGKSPKGPRFNSDNKLIPYSVVGTLVKKEQRNYTRLKTSVSISSSYSSKSVKKSTNILSKSNVFNPIVIQENTSIEDKMKKKTYIPNLTYTDIFNIYDKSRKRINKNKNGKLESENKLFKHIPKIMKQYINVPLSKQEKALKNNEKYNDIFNKVENKICKSIKEKRKRNLSNNNESKNYDSKLYNTSNLIRNSATEYRLKIEKNNSNESKKTPNLVLNNPIQNWEMSLRRPKNFVGKRREYLNVRTDKNPYWIVLTEKNPLEEEKIINPRIHINTSKGVDLKKFANTSSYFKQSSKQFDLTLNVSTSNDMNNLEIKGRKLIDVEEKMTNKMKGNIKLVDIKYDKESLKNIIFKENYCINKRVINKKNKIFLNYLNYLKGFK